MQRNAMCGSPLVVSLFVVGLLAGSSWYTFNVLFYGSLSEGQSVTEVLMAAPSAQTLQRLSIFSQWPVYLPANATPPPTTTTIIPVDGCGDGFGCQGPNSLPDVRCPSTRACNVLGKQPVCLQKGECLDLCFVGDVASDNDCNLPYLELHGSIDQCLYSAAFLLHYRVSLLDTDTLQMDFYSQTDSLCLTSLSMFSMDVESCTPFSAPSVGLASGYITMLLAECSDFCDGDGFGCHLTSANILKEYPFCHTSQDCYANGGTVVCSNATFPTIRGSCLVSDGCGDGYGCVDGVADVSCPMTRQCLYDGGDPVCDFVPVPLPPVPIPTPTPVVPTTTIVPPIGYCTSAYIGFSNCSGTPINTTIVSCGVCYNDIYGFLGVSLKLDCDTLVTTIYNVDCITAQPSFSWSFNECFLSGFDLTTTQCPTIDTPTTTLVDCDNCYYSLNSTQTGPTSYECTNIINTTTYCCNECIYIAETGEYWKKTCNDEWGIAYIDSGCTIPGVYSNLPRQQCTASSYLLTKCTIPPSPPPNICSCRFYQYVAQTTCTFFGYSNDVSVDVCSPFSQVDDISIEGTCTSWAIYNGSTCQGPFLSGANNTCITDGVNSYKVICLPVALPPPPPPSPVPPPYLDCRRQQCRINVKQNQVCGSSYRNALYVGTCGGCQTGPFVPSLNQVFYYAMSCATGQVFVFLSPQCVGTGLPIAEPAPCSSVWTVSYTTTPAISSALNYYIDVGCAGFYAYQYKNLVVDTCQYARQLIGGSYTIWRSLIRKSSGQWLLYGSSDCTSDLIGIINPGNCYGAVGGGDFTLKIVTAGILAQMKPQNYDNMTIVPVADVSSQQDVYSRQKRQSQTSVGSCLENACLPYEGGYLPDVSNSRVQQCMDNGGTPVCELLSQNATFKCTSLCSNYIVYRDKDACLDDSPKNIIYSQPTILSSCTQDLRGRYVKYILITGPTYSNRALQITYTDSTCTVKSSEVVVNFANNPSRTCSSLPSTFQTIAISIAECSVIKYVDHCVPFLIGNNYFSVPASDDLEVVSCRSSGSVPYCPYNVDETPSDYQCNEWCKLDTIWLGTRDTISCVGGGLKSPLIDGDPVGYTKMGDCSPALGFYTTPTGKANSMIRIIPFYSLGLISGTQKVLVESYSDESCLNFAYRAILDQDYCSSNTYRQTLGACSLMDLQWNGVDGYGCHLRHVNNIYLPESYDCSLLDVDGCSCGTSCNVSQTFCSCEENPNCAFACKTTSSGTCVPTCIAKASIPAQETKKYYLPNELAPATISCMQSGRTPHCTQRGDTGWVGACDDMCYWQDSFNCFGGQCPYGAMFPLIDSRGLLQKAGQCFYWDAELNSDFPQIYGPARSVRGTYFQNQIALRFYLDDGCQDALPLSQYPIPISYRSFQCFSNNVGCFSQLSTGDATVLKVATCEEACNPDGYGCGFQNSGSYSSFGLPQLSCPGSQSCLAGCPTAGTELVNCFSEFAIPGFSLAGACPCQLIPVPENIVVNRQYNDTYHKTRSFFNDIFKKVTYYNLSHSDVKYEALLVDSNTTTTLDSILNIGKHGMQYIDRRMVGNPSGLNGCSLGIGLVLDKGQNPTIQIVEGQPLIVPLKYVIFAQVYEFTVDTPDFATLIPFKYDSQNDPEWIPLQMNQGEKILLLATLECGSNIQSVTVDYDGTFNWMYNFQ